MLKPHFFTRVSSIALNSVYKTPIRQFAKKSSVFKEIPKAQGVGIRQAIQICRDNANNGFDTSVDCSVTLSIDARKPNQNINTFSLTPNPLNRLVKILVFSGLKGAEDICSKFDCVTYGNEETIVSMVENKVKIKATHVFASPDIMPVLKKALGKKLGGKKLMPSDLFRTIAYTVEDLDTNLTNTIKGSVVLRNDKFSTVRFIFGRLSLSDDELIENLNSIFATLTSVRPEGGRKKFFLHATMGSTTGPGVKLNVALTDPGSEMYMDNAQESEVELELETVKKKVERTKANKTKWRWRPSYVPGSALEKKAKEMEAKIRLEKL